MSYLVLARKYRPETFEDIVGQEAVTRTLQNAIRQNKVHHAFLFTGTRGVGKTTTARVLARALCCQAQDGPTPTPCGTCPACQAIASGRATDIQEIDGASNNSVNDIRDLRDNVQYQPQNLRYKLYIIDEVHMLSQAAFNALLKTLEEPPAHVKFVFATTESHKIPQTILSRCQRYDFKSVGQSELAAHLLTLAGRENLTVSETAARLIARLARGSVRDSLSLFDAVIAYAGQTIRDEDVRLVLGMADAQGFENLARALAARDAVAAFGVIASLVEYGHDLRQFGADFLEYLRDLVLVASDAHLAASLDRPEAECKALVELAAKAHRSEWIAWFDMMVEGQERIARAEQARLLFELTLAKMLDLGSLRSVDELMSDVSRLLRAQPPASGDRGGARRPFDEAAAPVEPSPPPAPVTIPAPMALAPAAKAPVPAPAKTAASAPPVPTTFKALVEAIRTESRPLWAALMRVIPIEFAPPIIKLGCPSASITWDLIGEAKAQGNLSERFSRLLGQPVTLMVVRQDEAHGGASSIAAEHEADEQAARKRTDNEGRQDPLVRLTREVFGGGDVTVTPLSAEEAVTAPEP